jgi:predicted phage baseplate assembly protein
MLLPPKIDNRTYDDIVEQTVKLGQHFTVQDSSDVVANKLEELLDRTIAEDIKDAEGNIIAAAGTLIDQKIADALLKIESLKQVKVNSKGWCKPDKPDAGLALIRIFGRMAALVSDRLNQALEKNFLAFLDLIGTQILPPQPARVPLTFSLATGAKVDALVPARTQVAAPATAGENQEVVFETERDLVVTPAQLQAVFVRDPGTDCYSDYTQKATGIEDTAFSVFSAELSIEHSLYLACDQLFTLPEPKTVTLRMNSPETALLAGLPITWSYWDGATWQGLSSSSSSPNLWQVTIANLPIPTPLAIDGLNAAWVRAQLKQSPLQSQTSSLHIDQITAQVRIGLIDLAPDLCFFNSTPIDLSKDFYPFGEQPRFNDTFYIASKEAFARPGSLVTVTVTQSEGSTINTNGNVELAWEAWDGIGWVKLTTSSTTLDGAEIPAGSKTLPANFTASGKVKFTLSQSTAPTVINGETNGWIRVRIVKGNYGTEATFNQSSTFTLLNEESKATTKQIKVTSVRGFMPDDTIWIDSGSKQEIVDIESVDIPKQTFTLKTALTKDHSIGTSVILGSASAFASPSLNSLKLSYTYDATAPISACRTYNDFTYLDPFGIERVTPISEDAASGQNQLKVDSIGGLAVGDRISMNSGNQAYEIQAIAPNTKTVTLKTPLTQAYAKGTQVIRSFEPFTATADSKPTLYLGFDQPFPNQAVALYAQVEPPKPDEVTVTDGETISTSTPQPPRLVWEYASPSGWKRLGVQDETSAFAERGMIRFIGTPDFTTGAEFGQSLYWLRVRWESGEFRLEPRLRRLLTNTTWASQTTTIENENLGSSDGNPNQTFRTTNSPVLLGQRLEVKEQEVLSPAEQSAIEQLEGADAVTILRDEAGIPEAVWVRWHEVPDFYGSGLRDRHYTINRITGEVLFGDGQHGMVPPIGRNNLRMSLYQIGGGEQGNKEANTVNQLKTTVPYIDSVTNLEAAGGGTDLEPMERVKERGPKVLRHRGRAVTVQDFEDLAYEASPDVARVKAIAPNRIVTNGKISSFDPLAEGLWLDANHQASDEHNKVQNVGQVQLLIVPRSSALQPVPSLALIEQVETYIRDRASPTVILRVGSPEWLKVSVTAEIVPTSLEVADTARNAVIQRLDNFLHPLIGGVRGQGWEFGREPHESDFYALIEAINSVDYVRSLSVSIEPKLPEPPEPPKPFLIFSGNHNIAVI